MTGFYPALSSIVVSRQERIDTCPTPPPWRSRQSGLRPRTSPPPGGPNPIARVFRPWADAIGFCAAPGFREPRPAGKLPHPGAPPPRAPERLAEMSLPRLHPTLLHGLAERIVLALAVLLICGLLAATLVRMAPGFGMDERMLDMRLGSGSQQAIERQGAAQSNIPSLLLELPAPAIPRRPGQFALLRPAGQPDALRTPGAELPLRVHRTRACLDARPVDGDRPRALSPWNR